MGVRALLTNRRPRARSTGAVVLDGANTPAGLHGLHIHDTMVDESTYNCTTTGSHWDTGATGGSHGDVNAKVHHTGDLGNVKLQYDKRLVATTGYWDIESKDKNLSVEAMVNMSLVLHAGEDDLGSGSCKTSAANGCAGGRIVCGNIILLN